MRKLITSGLGILCGIVIIVMAFLIQAEPVVLETENFTTLRFSAVNPDTVADNYVGDYESNKYYGGDAYTGMQQASAQAANNILAMDETLLQNNENIRAVNENLKSLNENLTKANANMVKAAEMQTMNLETASNAIAQVVVQIGFYLLLAAGLVMVVSNLNPFMDNLEVYLASREKTQKPVTEEEDEEEDLEEDGDEEIDLEDIDLEEDEEDEE